MISSEIHEDALGLMSIQKSGTNYLRLLLINYFCSNGERIGYTESQKLFPNRWENNSDIKKWKTPTIGRLPFSDFVYGHKPVGPYSKLITLYRNPLDHIVSFWYYAYENRVGGANPRINDVAPQFIKRFIHKYKWQLKEESIHISYEDLVTDTAKIMMDILEYIEVDFDSDLVRQAIEFSSAENLKKEEKELGSAVHWTRSELKGSFVRDGSIGQWRKHLSQRTIDMVFSELDRHGLDANDFTFEYPINLNN